MQSFYERSCRLERNEISVVSPRESQKWEKMKTEWGFHVFRPNSRSVKTTFWKNREKYEWNNFLHEMEDRIEKEKSLPRCEELLKFPLFHYDGVYGNLPNNNYEFNSIKHFIAQRGLLDLGNLLHDPGKGAQYFIFYTRHDNKNPGYCYYG